MSIIIDLDNCISDDGWRINLINWSADDLDERYREYHEAMGLDKSANKHLLKNTQDIIIFTSRPELYRPETEKWLAQHNIRHSQLFMRPLHNQMSSLHLKKMFLDIILCLPREVPSRAYDDRPDIVEMYLSRGIQAEVVKIHDICAYTPPKTAPIVPALLRAAAKTFEERNALYGDNYKHFGRVMASSFPEGLSIKSAEDWNRLGLLVQMISKITRYNANFNKGGHDDSLLDLSVYSTMLRELDSSK